METKKILRLLIVMVITGFFFIKELPAKSKSFIREYSYNASEADSKLSARAIALTQVKELLLEELGAYIHSTFNVSSHETLAEFKEVSNSELASMAAGVTQTKILDETWNGEIYYLKAKITIEEEDFTNRIKEISGNKEKVMYLKLLKRQADSALAEINRLKEELSKAKTKKDKLALQMQYSTTANKLEGTEWYQHNLSFFEEGRFYNNNQNHRMEIVFVLDATGSMGGMIANAKNKIWAIANTLAQSEPKPEISFGLVHFRDRGDSYVTRRTMLTTDLDKFYYDLMHVQAGGGGDTPESVNQALAEAIHQFQWDPSPHTFKSVFLLGDSPPHMNYNDIKYPQSCKVAIQKDIIINTILCGHNGSTEQVWREIAAATQGDFIRLSSSGSRLAVSTPYDKLISEKARLLDATRMYYGTVAEQSAGQERQAMAEAIQLNSSEEETARRAVYNVTTISGKKNFVGKNEILSDFESNAIDIEEMDEDELPGELASIDREERESYLLQRIAERKDLEDEIKELNNKRKEYLDKELDSRSEEVKGSFNYKVFDALKKQTEKKGFKGAATPSF